MRFIKKAALASICGATMGVVVLLGGLVLRPAALKAQGAAKATIPSVIQAKRFELVDDKGITRLVMFYDKYNDSAIKLKNSEGTDVTSSRPA